MGDRNTADGYSSLNANTSGSDNTAIGYYALVSNTANGNTATGSQTLRENITGTYNTATGYGALSANTADGNTANGVQALTSNQGGFYNTAVGYAALRDNTAGSYNTALGNAAGSNITGSGNVCIGQGLFGEAGVSGTTWIKNVYASQATARAVYVDGDNKIGTQSSSRRYKEEIKPMDTASETLFALKPVTFRYKKEIDRSRALSFGLIAEEVVMISPDLITRDEEGQPQTVRYEAINAMLLNEFLKEHRTVKELKSTLAKQEAMIAEQHRSFQRKLTQQETQIEALTSGLQKVSAQMETMKPVTQMVINEP
jgi:Chaperone of endosialidase